ncbi:TnsD family Tn7-like transposition protein [Shewanella sp.]|uniref:TnsD family Tn7-like transposition protein n=2 Tax=Shewanella sp. TaxID=50422 RepID=UPI0040541E2B
MLLPPQLPDELLLGRLIRYLAISGDEVGAFCEKAFGSNRISLHPLLTAGIEHLSHAVGESPEELLHQQTLAPLFLFYLPEHASKLKKYLLANEGAKALRESQLPSYGHGGSVCLKWCQLCAKQDIQSYGVTYWHRAHQIPGVIACYKHSILLKSIELEERKHRLDAGLLPSCHGGTQAALDIESCVAKFSQQLTLVLMKALPVIELSSVYRWRLADLGFITSGGRVRRQLLMRQFITWAGSYHSGSDTPLPNDIKDYRYLSELLNPKTSHHPFRHLLFASWLFSHPNEIFKQKHSEPNVALVKPSLIKAQQLENKCLKLLEENRSMAEVSRLTGKSRCYLKRIALQHGIKLNLKPRLLTSELKSKIVHLARSGMHRKSISERCDIGVGSVEQVISSVPDLVDWRKKCHFESMRRRYRLEIQSYRLKNHDAIRRDIKSDCNAAFFWLYLYDRDWLEATLPSPAKPIGHGEYVLNSD